MTHYPLLLAFKGTFFGQGFVAEVEGSGRLLAAHDDAAGEWWLYGVNPGALAADGATLDEAHVELRQSLVETMQLFAAEATSYERFKAEVTRYFMTTNDAVEVDRLAALERVRATREQVAGLPTVVDKGPCVTVTKKSTREVTPADNAVNADLAKAA